MSSIALRDTSYVVLGLIAEHGPATSYDLKQMVASSIGYFWSFPHSQLYAEPARLAEAGLLDEEQESGGRRRRRYTITPAGQAELEAWLRQPTTGAVQLRDPGLLQLFFADLVEPADVARLARTRLGVHREQLATYRSIEAWLAEAEPDRFASATVRRGIYAEEGAVQFWTEIARRVADDEAGGEERDGEQGAARDDGPRPPGPR